jgi:hypothetical protein
MKYHVRYLSLALLLLAACKKDTDLLIGEEVPYEPEVFYNTSLAGQVHDAAGNALQGVEVSITSQSALTDTNGYFELENVSLDATGAPVRFEYQGHFAVAKTILPRLNDWGYQPVVLPSRQPVATFMASAGATVNRPNLEIRFPNGGYMKPNGSSYTNAVTVYAYLNSIDDPDYSAMAPGNWTAIREEGKPGVVAAFGLLSIELEGQNGEQLQFDSIDGASARLDIPDAYLATAPGQTTVWELDEIAGRWRERGIAIREGGAYQFNLSAASIWAVGEFHPAVRIAGRLVSRNGAALARTEFRWAPDGGPPYGGYTNAEGAFQQYVPAGRALRLTLPRVQNCGSNSGQSLGPFNASNDLGALPLDFIEQEAQLYGLITDCAGTPIDKGYLLIEWEAQSIIAPADGDGRIDVALPLCNSTAITYSAFQLENSVHNEAVQMAVSPGQTFDLDTLSACPNPIAPFFTYRFNGGPEVDAINFFANFNESNQELGLYLDLEDVDGLMTNILINDFNGPGDYEPYQVNWRMLDAPTFFPCNDSSTPFTVSITASNGMFVEGTYSGELASLSVPPCQAPVTLEGAFKLPLQ